MDRTMREEPDGSITATEVIEAEHEGRVARIVRQTSAAPPADMADELRPSSPNRRD